jgi:hypothetical protein
LNDLPACFFCFFFYPTGRHAHSPTRSSFVRFAPRHCRRSAACFFSRYLRAVYLQTNNQHFGKMGWSRVNFNYFFEESTVDYIIAAVEQIAYHGWKLLPQYTTDPFSGMFFHRNWEAKDQLRLLQEARLDAVRGQFVYDIPGRSADEDPAHYLALASELYASAKRDAEVLADDIFADNGACCIAARHRPWRASETAGRRFGCWAGGI